METANKDIYRCPACLAQLSLTVKKARETIVQEGELRCPAGHLFSIADGIPDLTWPGELTGQDRKNRDDYDKLADDYEKYASIPFQTFREDADRFREKMTDQLKIKEDSIVLEVGSGDGRGSLHIAKRLGHGGRLFLQEFSPGFLRKSFARLKDFEQIIDYSIASASYIPFPDRYFDAAHHFGGIGTFSDVKRCLKELARVVKPGGKVLVGDESLGPWLKDTEFGKIMSNSNPLLRYRIPLEDIPVEARDVKVEWVLMGAFFLLEFTVGEGEPVANYHVPIPGKRGGNHWIRYHGNLEGVTEKTKNLAHQAREKAGISMHDWLERIVEQAALDELKRK